MLKRILLSFIVLLSVSGFAHAQSSCQKLALSGNLIIPGNNYPDYIEVQVRMGEQVLARAYLDITNKFTFDDVPEGRYEVVVNVEGYKELREILRMAQPISTSLGCTTQVIYWLQPVDDVVIVDERLKGYPKESIDEFILAVRADKDKHYEDVVKHLEKVVKLAADWFDAHCELGAAYEEVHRPNDAEGEYKKALELKPDSFRALMSLGRLYVSEADEKLQNAATAGDATPFLAKAHEVLATAVTRDPMSAMASYLLGAVDFRQSSYPAAETALKHALELDGNMFPARIMLMNVYVKTMQWQEALDSADDFLLEYPGSPYRPEVTNTRASIMRRLQAGK